MNLQVSTASTHPPQGECHEPSEVLIVLEYKCADRVEVHHVRLAVQHIVHNRAVALQAVGLHRRLPCSAYVQLSTSSQDDDGEGGLQDCT